MLFTRDYLGVNFNTFQRTSEAQKVFAKLNRKDVTYAFESTLCVSTISKAKKCYFKEDFNFLSKNSPYFCEIFIFFSSSSRVHNKTYQNSPEIFMKGFSK